MCSAAGVEPFDATEHLERMLDFFFFFLIGSVIGEEVELAISTLRELALFLFLRSSDDNLLAFKLTIRG